MIPIKVGIRSNETVHSSNDAAQVSIQQVHGSDDAAHVSIQCQVFSTVVFASSLKGFASMCCSTSLILHPTSTSVSPPKEH